MTVILTGLLFASLLFLDAQHDDEDENDRNHESPRGSGGGSREGSTESCGRIVTTTKTRMISIASPAIQATMMPAMIRPSSRPHESVLLPGEPLPPR